MTYNPNWSTAGVGPFYTFTGSIDVVGAVTAVNILNPFTKSRMVGCVLHSPSKDFTGSAGQLALGLTTPGGAELAAAASIATLVDAESIKNMPIILDEVRTEAQIYLNVIANDAGPNGVVYYSVTFARLD